MVVTFTGMERKWGKNSLFTVKLRLLGKYGLTKTSHA